MGNRYYNGYSWAQRVKILQALDNENAQGRTYLRDLCDICGDRAASLHSEDYSEPYTFIPPQCYSLCRACHRRIHRRFIEPPEEWAIWLEHIRAGGYGSEFPRFYVPAKRLEWYPTIQDGHPIRLEKIRDRVLPHDNWWERLSLDPETLTAAWARPRTLRPRPSTEQYSESIRGQLSLLESSLLLLHSNAGHSSISMTELSQKALTSFGRVSAAKVYRDLGKRLCKEIGWEPDRFRTGYQNWASVIAEPWRTNCGGTEWVLVEALSGLTNEMGGKALVRCQGISEKPDKEQDHFLV